MSKVFTIDELVAFGNFVLDKAGIGSQVTGELIEAFNNRGAEETKAEETKEEDPKPAETNADNLAGENADPIV